MNNKKILVQGQQWGDEAKARVVGDWSDQFDFCVRYSGGNNCGGQVIKAGKKYVHHLLPAVDYSRSKAKSFLASGMVIHMPSLLEEIKTMQQDFPNVGKTVIVDPCAFIVKDEFIEEDKITGIEQQTTYKGIKQAYTSKVNRTGTRIYDLINNKAPIIQALKDEGVQFIPLLKMKEVFESSSILFEGNQGQMLDLERGLFPNITSSNVGIAGVVASGFNWFQMDKIYGVAKGTYITRSGGAKKLPTEMPDEEANVYVEKANEKGNTTGRNRNIGYMDLVALKYACDVGAVDALILTKLDIANGMNKIKVCVGYEGKEDAFSPADFDGSVPQYVEVDGWKDASNPEEVRHFISFVEEKVGKTVDYYSCGIGNKDLINYFDYYTNNSFRWNKEEQKTGFVKYGGEII